MDLARQEQYMSTQNNNNNNVQHGGGLVRFRSAPSSFFAANIESADERVNIMSSFLDDDLNIPDFEEDQDIKPSLNTLLNPPPNSSTATTFPTQHNIHTTPHPLPHQQYKSELPPQYPRNQIRSSGGLARQSSSPAGFFNGYAPVAGMGSFRMGPGATPQVGASNSALTEQSGFPSRMQSSLGLLSRISEVGDEGMDGHSPNSSSSQVKLGSGDVPFFRSAYPVDSWEDSAQFLENNVNMLPGSQIDQGSRPRPLSHHLSLPKTSTELSTMEMLMQFPDSVPCKIRAKRGCATHPRSIAERVRRTRISERMRKLQELVPNMDKQTNTSDMLDLAVDHIKDLQRQFKMLSEKRASCKCAGQLLIRQQPY